MLLIHTQFCAVTSITLLTVLKSPLAFMVKSLSVFCIYLLFPLAAAKAVTTLPGVQHIKAVIYNNKSCITFHNTVHNTPFRPLHYYHISTLQNPCPAVP
jgi:hypothetical protein